MIVKLIVIPKTLATLALTKLHIIKINCGQTSVVSEVNGNITMELEDSVHKTVQNSDQNNL